MRQNQRFMRRNIDAVSSDSAETLRSILVHARGVLSVQSITPHLKGGYMTVFELDTAHLEAFVDDVERAGWMSVM